MKLFRIVSGIVLLSALCIAPVIHAEDVSSFVFTTEPQSVAVGELSGAITVQSQTAGGVSQPIPETFDLAFTSSSATGQFLNVSGNPVSTIMSKNTSNRTFYYKDSMAGDFILTVVATGRTSLQSFSTAQHIFVGQPVSGFGNSDTATTTAHTTTNTTDTETSQTQSTPTTIYSAHSSPSPLSDLENKMEFEITSGRDRLTTVGNDVTFIVTPTRLQNVSASMIMYTWSFGDGTTATGNTVRHAYKFAGDYSVVVNAVASDKQAVSRSQVRVISPVFTIAKIPEGLEITNKSGMEVNLEGWSLVSSSKTFVFPKDMLIPSGKKITIPDTVTGLSSGVIQLLNPLNKLFASVSSDVLVQPTPNLGDIQAKINEVKVTLAQISPEPKAPAPVVVKHTAEQPLATSTEVVPEVSNTAIVFEAPIKASFVSSVFSWPVRGFRFIRHLFVEE